MTISLHDPALLRKQAYIDGTWTPAGNGTTFPVHDPADGSVIAEVADLRATEVQSAIDAAEAAFADWAGRTAKDRAVVLRRWHDLIMQASDDLSLLMTLEQGKPQAEARGEVAYGAAFIEWFAEEGKRLYGDIIPSPAAGKRIMVLKQPIGVCAAITPWNFPIAMITRKCAPAMAAGCPIVVKPSEDAPLCALALAELAERAGVPRGVLNIVTCSNPAQAGDTLTASPQVTKLSFTGSTPVGKHLMRQCADTVKKVSLELGGNAPFIIFDDADLDEAVDGLIASKFRNAGQTCICANRILVQDGIHDALVSKLREKIATMTVGPGTDATTVIGPLINARALDKVQGLVGDALDQGATAVIGGTASDGAGNYYRPTILSGVTGEMRIAQEEIFGPVAPVQRFRTEEEAVTAANNTRYGLAAYCYTRDFNRTWRVAEGLQYGIVGINEGLVSTEVAPFGGTKESGIGREGSSYGIEDYIEIKYVCLGGIRR